MKFKVRRLEKEEWSKLLNDAHIITFGEYRDASFDTSNYSLLVLDENDTPAGWITCHEMDKDTVYWQHGGVFPNYRKTLYVWNGYSMCVAYAAERYKRITTRIEAQNMEMLKLAHAMDFEIRGSFHNGEKLFLELILNFGG